MLKLLFCRSYTLLGVALLLPMIISAQQPGLVIPVGHVKDIRNTCFSPDGTLIATSAGDNTVKLWHTASGRLLKTLYGHKSLITTLEFSPLGNYLLSSSSDDGTNRIWNLRDGQEIIQVDRATYPLKQVYFSASEKWAVSLHLQAVGLWNLATGQKTDSFKLKKPNGEYHFFSYAAISPDGRSIAGYDYGRKMIVIWDRISHVVLKKITYDTGYGLLDFNFSADNRQLYVFTSGAFIAINISTGKTVFTSKRYSTALAAPQLTGKGRYLFTGGYDQWFKVVNRDTMETASDEREIYQPALLNLQTFTSTLLKGEKPPGTILYLKIDNTGKALMALTYDSIILYRIDNFELVRQTGFSSDSLSYGKAFSYSAISPDGKSIVFINKNGVPVLYDNRGNLLATFTGNIAFDKKHYFSNDGNLIFTSSGNAQKFSWDIKAGKLSPQYDTAFTEKNEAYELYLESLEGLSYDTLTRHWRINQDGNTVIFQAEGNKRPLCRISRDGRYAITYAGGDSLLKIWDAKKGVLLYRVLSRFGDFSEPVLSNDGHYIALMVSNAEAQLDIMWETLQKELDGDTTGFRTAADFPTEIRVLEMSTGKQLFYLQDTSGFLYSHNMSFSEGGKYFSLAAGQLSIRETGNWQEVLSVKNDCERKAPAWAVSPDGNLVLVSCKNNSAMYRAHSNELVFVLPGAVKFGSFSDDGNRILTESDDRQLKIWDTRTGKLLYTYYAFDNGDYIVTDAYERYDGTEEARKKLYYACGNEFIDLAQFKDQLWVPQLAERIMQGDTINAPKLSDLNICGLTPEVENRGSGTASWHFIITPRRGGLGETVLYVNGIEAKRYKSAELKKLSSQFELRVTRDELKSYFIPGRDNTVSVKAFTTDNIISSRGVIIRDTAVGKSSLPPNLFAVMVGVSDYKGDELDLKYAAKDAGDISAAIAAAARKMLNTDNKEHVFMYNLTTAKERYMLPEKAAIKKTLEEIGKRANANDILLIFFAGHGVMAGETGKKQFYFLTADASSQTLPGTSVNTGISTAELTEWMKPQNIKAQKRVLIFDACNSGQAIRDFVQLGKENQGYTAARNDERSQQIKAIDKLNEKSGLFILSASASNQDAYEMSRYAQGLLTYSLLKAMKLQPDILQDGKYLDLSRWFNAAEKTVSELSRESGARQEPQIVSNTNFTIGIVDEEVMASIILPQEKPVFTASNFQNSDEAADGDDLEISKGINLRLHEMSARGSESRIVYFMASNSPAALTLSGRYDVKDNEVVIRVSIKKNNETKFRFEEKGTKTGLQELIRLVAVKAADWAEANK